MKYLAVANSDIGKIRRVNQDSVVMRHRVVEDEEVVFSVLCDGMGGMSCGEIASASVCNAFLKWFDEKFTVDYADYDEERLLTEWYTVINAINKGINDMGTDNGVLIGTTMTVLLIFKDAYYVANIGDSRAYKLGRNGISQMTIDHSVVEQEIKAGRLTRENARFDKRRNQLTRSIGVLNTTKADFFKGKIVPGIVFMMCSDGVRNMVNDEELLYYFHPSIMTSIDNMNNNIQYIFNLNQQRNEKDNMTITLIKVNEDDHTAGELADDKESEDITILNSETFVEVDMRLL